MNRFLSMFFAAFFLLPFSIFADANGNLTSDISGTSNVANTWNYRNELTSTTIVSGGQMSVNYGYDSTGQRISLTETASGLTTATKFPTPSYSETVKPDGTIERTVSIEAAGLPVATIRTVGTSTPEVFATHTDHLRSTRLVTTEGAGLGNVNIVEQTDYDSFGKITRHEQTGDFAEKKKFTGHEYDEGTAYTYAKARYLNTDIGRFVSEDSIFLKIGDRGLGQKTRGSVFDASAASLFGPSQEDRIALERLLANPQALNSYSYALNNPQKFVDGNGEVVQFAGVAVAVIARGAILGGIGGMAATAIATNGQASFGQYAAGAGRGAVFGAIGAVSAIYAATLEFGSHLYTSARDGKIDVPGAFVDAGTTLGISGIFKALPGVRGRDVSTFGKSFLIGAHTQFEALKQFTETTASIATTRLTSYVQNNIASQLQQILQQLNTIFQNLQPGHGP